MLLFGGKLKMNSLSFFGGEQVPNPYKLQCWTGWNATAFYPPPHGALTCSGYISELTHNVGELCSLSESFAYVSLRSHGWINRVFSNSMLSHLPADSPRPNCPFARKAAEIYLPDLRPSRKKPRLDDWGQERVPSHKYGLTSTHWKLAYMYRARLPCRSGLQSRSPARRLFLARSRTFQWQASGVCGCP